MQSGTTADILLWCFRGDFVVRIPAAAVLFWTLAWLTSSPAEAPKRNYPYRELRGTVEEFTYHRQWRSYYWREDFTMLVKDEAGTVHRVISREPTPWTDRRLGTTYSGLKVDWKQKPRVHIIGVAAVDRRHRFSESMPKQINWTAALA